MSIYEDRIIQDEARIRERIRVVAREVQRQLQSAVRALLTDDRQLATATVLGDLAINREIREIDHFCLQFVARHLPSAGHLRFVTAVRRLTIEIERVGDYAASIGRSAAFLSAPPPTTLLRDIELMADHAERVLAEAVEAFLEGNAERARGVRAMSDQMESTYHRSMVDLIRAADAGDFGGADLLALQSVLNRLERVSDQAKNICEETIFSATGESKPPKVYRILFVDAHHGPLSRMAEAVARRDYPSSGNYGSAGWAAADAVPVDPDFVTYLKAHDLSTGRAEPEQLVGLYDALSDYHFIVSLEGDPRPHLQELPYQTLVIEWALDADAATAGAAGAAGAAGDSTHLDSLRLALESRVRDLMTTLRGEGAA